MKKTMKELAELTGFSPATISRVLTKNKSVSAETRREVEKALSGIDYLPTRNPRKNYGKKTVLVISGETSSSFHTLLFSTMSSMLRESGYFVLVGHSRFDEHLEEEYVKYAQALGHCGIIMITPMDTPRLTGLLTNSSCPVVLVNRYLRSVDLDAVYMDNRRAGYMVARHLTDMGHRRIACLGGDDKSTSIVDRLSGFMDALADAGIPREDCYVWEGNLRKESGNQFGRIYLDSLREYTAVFSFNEPMARGFVETVQSGGLVIPEDVSVICIAPMVANITGNVELSCVIHNAELLGRTAVEMLMDRLGGLEQAPRKIVFPPQLCVRDSVKKLL